MERASQGRRVPVPALLAVLASSIVGVLDECIQAFLPSRVFDLRDILFNILAGLMAVTASLARGWARRRAGRLRRWLRVVDPTGSSDTNTPRERC